MANYTNKRWVDNAYGAKAAHIVDYNNPGKPSIIRIKGENYSEPIDREDVLKRVRQFIKARRVG